MSQWETHRVYEGMKVNTAGLPLSASNVFNIK